MGEDEDYDDDVTDVELQDPGYVPFPQHLSHLIWDGVSSYNSTFSPDRECAAASHSLLLGIFLLHRASPLNPGEYAARAAATRAAWRCVCRSGGVHARLCTELQHLVAASGFLRVSTDILLALLLCLYFGNCTLGTCPGLHQKCRETAQHESPTRAAPQPSISSSCLPPDAGPVPACRCCSAVWITLALLLG